MLDLTGCAMSAGEMKCMFDSQMAKAELDAGALTVQLAE